MPLLRMRKAVRDHGQQVVSVAAWASRGLQKLGGRLISTCPGTEAEVLDALAAGLPEVEPTTGSPRDSSHSRIDWGAAGAGRSASTQPSTMRVG